MAQKPYMIWSLGPKALKYKSLEPLGKVWGSEAGFSQFGAEDVISGP